MKKAVITGATSLIGKQLTASMLASGWNVFAVVRRGRILPQARHLTSVTLNMEEYSQLGKAVGACDCFIHLAWNGTRGEARMDEQLQHANCQYSTDAVRSILDTGCQCVISAGSQAEYGLQSTKVSEDTPCNPNTAYGRQKLNFYNSMEYLCKENHVHYREPRIFSLYGPEDYASTMVMSTLSSMLRGVSCDLTEGIQMWDFLYIDDAVEALLKLCEPYVSDGVYNFGSGDARPLRSFIEEMAQITDTKSELLFGAVPYPTSGVVSIWPDISKLKTELNWSARTPFADGIRKVIHSVVGN